MKKNTTALILSFLLCFFSVPLVVQASAWPADDPGDLLYSTSEPSGIVYHSRTDSLFFVEDNGWIRQINISGTLLNSWNVGGDLEGITVVDDSTNNLYIGVENAEIIKEFNFVNGSFTGNQWDVSTEMNGFVNQGLEALTFVPNGYHPYSDSSSGGLFYAGLQSNGNIYIFDINLSVDGDYNYIDMITTSYSNDISGLNFHVESNILFAVFDFYNVLVEFSSNGTVLNTYTLPGNDQEGVSVKAAYPDSSAHIFIAEDEIEVYKYENYPITTYDDNDDDGLVSVVDSNDNDFDNDGFETGTDCDDTNASLTVTNIYYQDNDGDLYGVSTGTLFCLNSAPEGYVTNNNDLDDTDPLIGDTLPDPTPEPTPDPEPIPDSLPEPTPDSESTPDPEETELQINVEGQYLYVNDQQIELLKNEPRQIKYKVTDFHENDITEVIILALFKRRAVLIVAEIDEELNITIVKKKHINFKKLKKKVTLKINTKKNRIITKFKNKKKINTKIWKYKAAGTIKKIK